MSQYKTINEAKLAGLKKSTKDEIENSKKTEGGIYNADPQLLNQCYVGPCIDGYRTVCYYSDTGCDDCFQDPDNCS